MMSCFLSDQVVSTWLFIVSAFLLFKDLMYRFKNHKSVKYPTGQSERTYLPYLLFIFGILLSLPSPLQAQEPDTSYSRLVSLYTSDARFLPPSLASIPDHSNIPSPADFFGDIVGAPGVMHRTAEIYDYYRSLAEASARIAIEEVGASEGGRPFLLVIIADEATMDNLGDYRSNMARLADPRTVTEEASESLISTLKPIYYLNGGLHSPEMGSPEMLMELAYRLVASNKPSMRNIRENVITLINPVSEPDGRDRQVDWYYRYTKDRTDWDDGFPRSVPYWGEYVVHDNNRDGIQISQALTNVIVDSFFEWHPTVMLDLHESVPLLYISTGTGPYNELIDPITIGEWQILANHDLTAVTAEGLPGAFTWAFYDGWWPGYAIWVANNHNAIGRFYETFGNAGANTFIRDLSRSRFTGDPVTKRTWYRPEPATSKIRWSSRDNINYMEAGVIASLTYAANNGEQLIRNFYRKSLNSIERGRSQKPHAYLIPRDQRNPLLTAYLVNQLRRHGIEVHRQTEGDSAGDYFVLLDQPYRDLAVSLLSRQNFPADADHTPYDDIAWTLGYLYGVEVEALDDSTALLRTDLQLLTEDVQHEGVLNGSGNTFLLDYRAQSEVLPAMYWLKDQDLDAKIWVLEQPLTLEADTLSAGSVVFEGISRDVASEMTERFGFDLKAAVNSPDGSKHQVDLPCIAVYHSWYNTQDEGWIRFTFEQAGVPYTSIDKDDLRDGSLLQRFDVILVPSLGGSVEQLIHGVDARWSPMPYTQTADFPSHGTPDATEDITGGPGFEGFAELIRFVEEGGVLVTLENATRMVAETGIARPLSPYSASGLFHPGSVVRAKSRRKDHPILYGFPETFHIFRGNAPLYQVARRDRSMMVLQYGTKPLSDEVERDVGPMLGIPETADTVIVETDTGETEDPTESESVSPNESEKAYVLSGMVRNEQAIIGQGAIFDVPVGAGRVIAFTFNPMHRYLNHHDFPLVWNVLINWNGM